MPVIGQECSEYSARNFKEVQSHNPAGDTAKKTNSMLIQLHRNTTDAKGIKSKCKYQTCSWSWRYLIQLSWLLYLLPLLFASEEVSAAV